MDKRFNTLSLAEQLALRKKAVDDLLAHPEWSLAQAIRHLKTTMRLTTAELAKLAGIGFRTLQDIEGERSEGTVQTMNRVLGVVGLKLGVALIAAHDANFSRR
jgi:DNA-binding XRE family transcriptional regulator